MSMPTFEDCMVPVLRFIGSRDVSSTSDILENTTQVLKLSEEEKNEFLPNSRQTKIYNRITWARFYLYKAGLIDRKKRGNYSITTLGEGLLSKNPKAIDKHFLYENYPSFKEWMDSSKVRKQDSLLDLVSYEKLDPYERLEKNYISLKDSVLSDLLDRVKEIDPQSFEELILNLLQRIGYGGSDGEGIKHTGKSGDEGIDGEIKQDHLGLDRIYMQAKRYKESTVGRPEIQKFVGTLSSKKSKKGLFITTSRFSKEAQDYIEKIDSRLVLIDGQKLVELLYEYNLGVKTEKIFNYKKIEDDFFDNELSFGFGKVA